IECEHQGKCNEQCTEAFKIIPDELAFYKRMNLQTHESAFTPLMSQLQILQ
ncbi:MAG: hypothetical protein UT09_C0023G0016, partial [Parcubacteria group bacterium GW2011_GWF2_38_8]